MIDQLKVKLFADGAEKLGMLEMYNNPLISGTNMFDVLDENCRSKEL